jgi:hypothetical protein
VRGLPDDVFESPASQEQFFDIDELAILWNMRLDIHPLWRTSVTDYSGNITGP